MPERWAIIHTVTADRRKHRTVTAVITGVPDHADRTRVRQAIDDAGKTPHSAGIPWGNHELRPANTDGTWPHQAHQPPATPAWTWHQLTNPPGRRYTLRNIPPGQYTTAATQAATAPNPGNPQKPGISLNTWALQAWQHETWWQQVPPHLRHHIETAPNPPTALTHALQLLADQTEQEKDKEQRQTGEGQKQAPQAREHEQAGQAQEREQEQAGKGQAQGQTQEQAGEGQKQTQGRKRATTTKPRQRHSNPRPEQAEHQQDQAHADEPAASQPEQHHD